MPVIKCFSIGQNVNILNILHVHRRRFRTVSVDTHVPETVARFYTKRVSCKKIYPSWCDLNETFLLWVTFVSVCPISVGLQLNLLAQNDWLFCKQLFMNIKMKNNIIRDRSIFIKNMGPVQMGRGHKLFYKPVCMGHQVFLTNLPMGHELFFNPSVDLK